MRLTNEQVALRAFNIILEVMGRGSDKDGANDTWLDKPTGYHGLKAIRHQTTAMLEDSAEHRENALVRLIMDICQREYLAQDVD